jgi:LacI family transcriptional regulator, fructose operon transcriptional repressor
MNLGRFGIAVELLAVLIDTIESALKLVSHLLENGHRRIGAIVGLSEITTGRERKEGYLHAFRAYGIAPEPELIVQVSPKERQGYEVTQRLLNLPNSPSALHAIRDRGLVIPHDIALAAFDESPWSSLVEPGITVIEQPTYELGQLTAELLLKRLEQPERPTTEITLKGKLIVRQSSAYFLR